MKKIFLLLIMSVMTMRIYSDGFDCIQGNWFKAQVTIEALQACELSLLNFYRTAMNRILLFCVFLQKINCRNSNIKQ